MNRNDIFCSSFELYTRVKTQLSDSPLSNSLVACLLFLMCHKHNFYTSLPLVSSPLWTQEQYIDSRLKMALFLFQLCMSCIHIIYIVISDKNMYVCACVHVCVGVYILKAPRYSGYSINCLSKNHSIFSRNLICVFFILLIPSLKVKKLFCYSFLWPWFISTIVLLTITNGKTMTTLKGTPLCLASGDVECVGSITGQSGKL